MPARTSRGLILAQKSETPYTRGSLRRSPHRGPRSGLGRAGLAGLLRGQWAAARLALWAAIDRASPWFLLLM